MENFWQCCKIRTLPKFGYGALCRIVSTTINGVSWSDTVGKRKPTKFIDVVIELFIAMGLPRKTNWL